MVPNIQSVSPHNIPVYKRITINTGPPPNVCKVDLQTVACPGTVLGFLFFRGIREM